MATSQSLPSFSLLIVEDDKAACDIIAGMIGLEFPDYTISKANNGINGLELFKQTAPDIVITDINMPAMNGIEMAREIKLINDKATFIVLTAYGDKSYFDQFATIGFCAYLLKPIDFQQLFAMIEKCSAELEQQRQQFRQGDLPRR